MDETDIRNVIQAFADAAGRAAEAGADAIQLHCAHGYLINEFLSPFFNDRRDEWGGTDEGRFRFLKQIMLAVRQSVPDDMPITVKLNTHDYTPKKGMTPELAKTYVEWLVDLNIDGVELSCGTYYTFHTVRGDIPLKELAFGLPRWMRPIAKLQFKRLAAPCKFEEAYNLRAAQIIKPVLGDIPLLLVGGLRRLSQIEAFIEKNTADFISMSRPFNREPSLVKRFKEGKVTEASCISCNRCFAAIFNEIPLNCYVSGIPSKYFSSR